MPGRRCAIVGCNNSRVRTKETNPEIVYHNFPKDPHVRKEWVRCCKRLGNWNPNTSQICSVHFTEDDYEPDMRNHILGLPLRKLIKKNAVPTLILPINSQNVTRLTRRNRSLKKKQGEEEMQRQEEIDNIMLEESTGTPALRPKISKLISGHATKFRRKRASALKYSGIVLKKRKAKRKILGTSRKTLIKETQNTESSNCIKQEEISYDVPSSDTNTEDNLLYTEPFTSDSIETIIKDEIEIDEENLGENDFNDNISEIHSPIQESNKKNKQQKTIEDNNRYLKLKEENNTLKLNIDSLNQLVNVLKKKLGEFDILRKYGGIPPTTGVLDLTDINRVCRFCLQKNQELKPLHEQIKFANPEISPKSILDILKAMGINSVMTGPNLPHKICLSCLDCLRSCYTFTHTYQKTEQILKFYTHNIFSNQLKANVSTDHNYTSDTIDKKCTVAAGTISKKSTVELPEEMSDLVENGVFKEKLIVLSKEKIEAIKSLPTIEDHPLICPVCFKELFLNEYRVHMLTHNALKRFLIKTDIPKKTRFFALPRNNVTLSQETVKVHSCPFCQDDIKTDKFVQHVQHHLKVDHFTCPKCERVFKKRRFLSQHMLMHEELPYKCETCDKGFNVKKSYECHLLTHTISSDEYPHQCEFCYKRFTNPSHLYRHQMIHTEHQTYGQKYNRKKCHRCLQCFKGKENFKNHKCQKLPVQICYYCKKAFSTLRSLHQHLKLEHGVQLIVCPICRIPVKNLTRHQRQHSLGPPYKCGTCSKEFTWKSNLLRHKILHTGEKPYLCSYCAKKFTTPDALQIHERTHTGDKRHICLICNRGFAEKAYLKKHMSIHLK